MAAQRAGLRRVAGQFQPAAADPGDPGRGGASAWSSTSSRSGSRRRATPRAPVRTATAPAFQRRLGRLRRTGQSARRLIAIGLGTVAFAMQDVLLEPYGGQILGLSRRARPRCSPRCCAVGGIIGFVPRRPRVSAGGADPYRVAALGALAGLRLHRRDLRGAAQLRRLFALGTGADRLRRRAVRAWTLTACDGHGAAPAQSGLALGTWGAVQATGRRHRHRRSAACSATPSPASPERRARGGARPARPPATASSTRSRSCCCSPPSSPSARSSGRYGDVACNPNTCGSASPGPRLAIRTRGDTHA